MIIRKAFKFKLKPSPEQRLQMAKTAGCVRLVWNKSLALVKEGIDAAGAYGGYCQMAGNLTSWKKEESTSFLKQVHSQPLQQTLRDLDRALKDGFAKSKGFPRFKKKTHDKSFRYPQGVKIEVNKVYLPKIAWMQFQKSQEIVGLLKNTTVSFSCGHWYISFQTEFEMTPPIHGGSDVGIDVGIIHFATFSDGSFVDGPRPLKAMAEKLAKKQKKLSRKVKGSNNWLEQKYRVQKMHKKIADVRRDFLHKTSANLCKNHARIMIEDLKVGNMSASAKGDLEKPGKNVCAKSGLNKAILDQGWYEFRRQLSYKAAWYGGIVVPVSPRNTSITCYSCRHISKENRKSQSIFECQSCGHIDNADVNGALNILAAGRAVIACGDISLVAG